MQWAFAIPKVWFIRDHSRASNTSNNPFPELKDV